MKTKTTWYIVIILSIAAIIRWIILLFRRANNKTILANYADTSKFSPVIYPTIVREDVRGSGLFGASRITRKHEGIDFECEAGQSVYAPFAGTITRLAYPYAGSTLWKGFVLEGDNGYTAKIFYVSPTKLGQKVNAGEQVAIAQAISKKYGVGMTDHIHVEILKDNQNIDPTPFFI